MEKVNQLDDGICEAGRELYNNNFYQCKISRGVLWYSQMANIAWMSCEALFLHYQIFANIFSDTLNMLQFYLIGWVAPLMFLVPLFTFSFIDSVNFKNYAQNELLNGTITMVEYRESMREFICLSHQGKYTTYFETTPIIISLFINMSILVNIIRTVVSKLKASTDKITMKALKATCLLMPLLGAVQFINIYNPFYNQENVIEGVWHIFNVSMRSLQGFIVCLCYCFTNSEVLRTLKRQYGHRFSSLKPNKSVHSNFSRSYTERSTQQTEAESISMMEGRNNSYNKVKNSPGVYNRDIIGNGTGYNPSRYSNRGSTGYKGPSIGKPKLLEGLNKFGD